MSTEENKAMVRRWFEEGWNQGNLDVADELFAPNYQSHGADPHLSGATGPQGPKQYTQMYRRAFPDAHITIEDVLSDNGNVVVRWSASGTHRGDFLGIPPTGRRATVTGINFYRVENGKIAESWGSFDAFSMMQALNLLRGPGQGGQ